MNALSRLAPMTLADFLDWEERQDRKYEFVGGRPVLMAGASKRHNDIAGNMYAALLGQLRGKPCRPYNADTKFLSPTGNARFPDVQVDCARLSSNEMHSTDPRVVIEVLSPSNDWLDVQERRADYQAHESVQHILLVSSLRVGAQIFTRDGAGWREETLQSLEGAFEFPAIGARLSMAEIYEGVTFEAAEEA